MVEKIKILNVIFWIYLISVCIVDFALNIVIIVTLMTKNKPILDYEYAYNVNDLNISLVFVKFIFGVINIVFILLSIVIYIYYLYPNSANIEKYKFYIFIGLFFVCLFTGLSLVVLYIIKTKFILVEHNNNHYYCYNTYFKGSINLFYASFFTQFINYIIILYLFYVLKYNITENYQEKPDH